VVLLRASLLALALPACSFTVTLEGPYSCEDGVCPGGWSCGADRLCVPPAPSDDEDEVDAGPLVSPPACAGAQAVGLDDGGCLVLHNSLRDYDSAASRCVREYGGFLAVITSADEQAALARLGVHGIDDAWIAADDRAREGAFFWSSGEAVELDFWAGGEPDDGRGSRTGPADCVAARLDEDGAWDDWPCRANLAYVCEHEPAGT
jgi:hypothetical protein